MRRSDPQLSPSYPQGGCAGLVGGGGADVPSSSDDIPLARGRLPALLPCVVALVAVVACLSGAPAVRASDVHGDEEQDRYVGTGGLILPGSIDHATRVAGRRRAWTATGD